MSTHALETFGAPEARKYTEPLLFIPGEYRFSQVGPVPYFSAVMPLENLVGEVRLVEDIPENARMDWSMEELFQRDINWNRVQKELVNGYLKDPNKLSFFNALTIALLPLSGVAIEESYGEPESIPPEAYPTWEKIDVGNVHVEFGLDRSVGVVQWHQGRVFPVAIDGQHRLAALKEYCTELKADAVANLPELRTKVPVILLILDERVGFKRRPGNTLIKTLREIFIDLNKNARMVSKSRLILLEDRNLQSVCVRTLLAKNATEISKRLPLSLVTWLGDEAKFDSGYSLSSVLNLNEVVGYCLEGALPDAIDPFDERAIKAFTDKITERLSLKRKIKESLKAHRQLCIGRDEPFSVKDEHLTVMEAAFREQWAPHILRVFREFTPYKRYLSKARDIGAIDGMLRDYLLLPEEQREKFRNRRKAESGHFNPREAIDTPLGELEGFKANEWAFYTGFQKALFLNFFELERHRPFPSIGGFDTRREDFLTWWLSQMNTLYEQGVFQLDWKKGRGDLWRGIAKNPGSGTIQFSKAATNRISAFITLCFWLNDAEQGYAKTFATCLVEDRPEDLPQLIRAAFQRRIAPGLQSLIRANMDVDEVEDSKLAKAMKKELVKRFTAINR